MNKHMTLLFSLALLGTSIFVSCKKEKNGCENGNLCFTFNGTDISVNAVRKPLPNSNTRLYWEEGADSNYKNIAIDVYGTSVGQYSFTENAGSAGDASFQYFIVEGGYATNHWGVSGNFDLTGIDDNVWTGTFSGVASDGSNSYEIKDGKFFEVPVE